jgi:hypothetical protein
MFFWKKVQEGGMFVVDRTSSGRLWVYWELIDSILAFWFQVPDPPFADERRAVIACELVENSNLSFARLTIRGATGFERTRVGEFR